MKNVIRLVQRLRSYHVSLYAANAAYYFMLSFFPWLVLLLSLLPHVGFGADDLSSFIGALVPSVLAPVIGSVIEDLSASTAAVISLSLVGSVWSSSHGEYYIEIGMNSICRVRETRGYLLSQALCMVCMVMTVFAILATLALHTFGMQLAAYCERSVIPLLRFFGALIRFRSLIVFFLLAGIFSSLYHVLPNRRSRWSGVFPGAAAAAAAWLLFSELFSVYITDFTDYSRFYGSLSVFAIGMLWLLCCMNILFYGLVLNELLFTADRSDS